MIKRIALAAAVLAVFGAASASAAVVPKTAVSEEPLAVVEAQYRRDRDRFDRGRNRGPKWVPGRRYDRPPPRWRRYGSRPGDWRRRGCVTVGPVWFCP
jgi:hypothetical protein